MSDTVRVFWKCKSKGCRETIVRDMPSHTSSRRVIPNDIRSADGTPWPIHWLSMPMEKAQREAFKHNNLMCSKHDVPMWPNVLQAKYNPDKICDGRCMSAKRASCDCSCNGENHGSGNI